LAFARFLSKVTLAYMTTGLFFFFALMYAKDWYEADPDGDAIEAGKKEAEGEEEDAGEVPNDEETSCNPLKAEKAAEEKADWAVLGKSFMGVFIAEWGDRTQIAMIGQHASQPLVPVFLGSVMAFFLLTLSAVGAATLLNGQKLRERVVFGFSACCFLIFGLLALKDAIAESTAAAGAESHSQTLG